MAIRVIKEPDIHITESELSRYRHAYQKAFTHYVGPVPSFEEFVRQQKAAEARMERDLSGWQPGDGPNV